MPLDTDEIAPPPKPARLDLEVLSIDALAERITALQAEIVLIEALIAKKKQSRDAAAALFKS